MTTSASNIVTPSPVTLVINQPQFLETLRSVMLDQGQFVVGRVTRRRTTQGLELIIDNWSQVEGVPNGTSMAPMLDWAVMVNNFHQRIPVERLIDVVHPKKSHLLVAISLEPDHHELFPVLILENGRVYRPERVRFIGSGLLTLPDSNPSFVSDADNNSLNGINAEDSRFTQSDAITDSSDNYVVNETLRSSRTAGALRGLYDRLRGLTVILVGAGRGGQELARQLVAAGIRRLIIIDGDRIGPENLDAMPMVTMEDVGEFKAVHLARVLRLNQPDLTVSCIPHSVFAPDAVRMLRETRADTVFSFIDSNAGRLAVSRLCQSTQTVHVDTGSLIEWANDVRNMSIDVRLFEPGVGCVACVPAMENLDDVLYELSAPENALRRGPDAEWNEHRAGSLLHLNAMACAVTLETWFAWLAGRITTSHWRRMRWAENGLPEFHASNISAAENCRFCKAEAY